MAADTTPQPQPANQRGRQVTITTTIEIYNKEPQNVELEVIQYGYLAIGPNLTVNNDGEPITGKRWQVYHAPSGKIIGLPVGRRAAALAAIQHLNQTGLDWSAPDYESVIGARQSGDHSYDRMVEIIRFLCRGGVRVVYYAWNKNGEGHVVTLLPQLRR